MHKTEAESTTLPSSPQRADHTPTPVRAVSSIWGDFRGLSMIYSGLNNPLGMARATCRCGLCVALDEKQEERIDEFPD